MHRVVEAALNYAELHEACAYIAFECRHLSEAELRELYEALLKHWHGVSHRQRQPEEGMDPIPQEWIKEHVDKLLEIAKRMPDGAMRSAVLVRAEYYMDLVKAFREANP